MSECDISDSVRVQDDVAACTECGSTSRVGRGFCLNCMLRRGLGCETETTETLEEVLDEIDVRDADWRIGNYQILEEIGRGGMGVIYRARQRHSRRIVALKRILSYQADSQQTLVRFRREAEAAASLDHPNILPIYEVSESDDGLPFFSMKFAAGGSLLDASRSLRNDPRRIIALMAKVARAVQFAHLQGILHRDLKPGNILLDGRGEPLVSDFGLAKWLDTSSDITRTLTIFGTPGYIAPEQAHGAAKNLTPAADIYSIGAVLFDLFTGRTPFLGEHALAVIKQAVDKPAPKLRTLAPLADRDSETICAKCLEREPQARYRSAGDLAEDLELWLEGRPIIARPVSPPTRIWRWSKRNPKLAGSIAACLLLGTAALVRQIQSRQLAAAAHEQALALHSVAVSPFLDLDTAKPDSKLAETIARALQTELSVHGPARVTPASSENLPLPADGKDISKVPGKTARTALQGTRRMHDGKLRVSLRLESTNDNRVLYRQIIEFPPSANAAYETARAVAPNIYPILDASNLSPIDGSENDPGWRNGHTRELLIAGRALQQRRTLADTDRAIECFSKAVIAEPKSALAHSDLAVSQAARMYSDEDLKYLSAAEASARTAISLNPNISETHSALSLVLYQQGHSQESLEELFTGYELADSKDRAPIWAAEILRKLGRPDQAIPWYRFTSGKANRPGLNEFIIGDCWSDLVDDDRAASSYRRASELFPELPEGWMGLCRLALLQKDFTAARKISSENGMRYRDFIFAEEIAAQVEFFSRNFREAEKLYQALAAKDPNGGGAFYGAVSYQSALGRLRLPRDEKAGKRLLQAALDKESQQLRSLPRDSDILYRVAAIESSLDLTDSAVAHLRAATETGWIDYRSMQLDPRFDAIAEHPQFKKIVADVAAAVDKMRNSMRDSD